MDKLSQERLFFALWPDRQVRDHLDQISQQASQHLKGKRISPENLHVTLAFIGEVEFSTRCCLECVAKQVQGQAFTLFFNKMDYWEKNQIFWVGAHVLPPALTLLVTDLSTRLQVCGYHPESRPYQVHITLLRKAHPITQTLPSWKHFSWWVEEFCLVRSQLTALGSCYEIIAKWPLNKK